MDELSLKVGEVYEAVLGQARGKAIYLGKSNGKGVSYAHTIIFRKEEKRFRNNDSNGEIITVKNSEIECWGFDRYVIENGKYRALLKVVYGVQRKLSDLEKGFIDVKVRSSGL